VLRAVFDPRKEEEVGAGGATKESWKDLILVSFLGGAMRQSRVPRARSRNQGEKKTTTDRPALRMSDKIVTEGEEISWERLVCA